MNPFASILVATLAIVPVAANASWFEFCDIQGKVQRVAAVGKGAYEVEVAVIGSKRASERGELSYTDCLEHVGKVMSVTLQIPAELGSPEPGDVVSFSRSSVDEFHKDGSFAGNEITVQFQEIQKVKGGAREG